MRKVLLLLAVSLIGCAPALTAPGGAAAPPTPAGACASRLGKSPFHAPGSTHILIADFDGGSAGKPDFADVLARRAAVVLGEIASPEPGNSTQKAPPMPTRPLERFMVGWHLYFQEDFRLAARAFEAAARDLVPRQPRGETVDLYLGRTLRRLPDPQSALDHARLALARVSGSDTVIEAALWSDIGGDLEDLGQHADALEALRRAAAPPRST